MIWLKNFRMKILFSCFWRYFFFHEQFRIPIISACQKEQVQNWCNNKKNTTNKSDAIVDNMRTLYNQKIQHWICLSINWNIIGRFIRYWLQTWCEFPTKIIVDLVICIEMRTLWWKREKTCILIAIVWTIFNVNTLNIIRRMSKCLKWSNCSGSYLKSIISRSEGRMQKKISVLLAPRKESLSESVFC